MRTVARNSSGVIVSIGFVAILSACGTNDYSIEAANYGQYGVALDGAPFKGGLAGNGTYRTLRIKPGIPGVHDDKVYIGRLIGHENSLPDKVTIHWKLAKLSNCKYEKSFRSARKNDKNDNLYTRKSRCSWKFNSKLKFEKVINLSKTRNTSAYKKSARLLNGFLGKKIRSAYFFSI